MKTVYYMQYVEGSYTCNVELINAKTKGGALRSAKSLAKQEGIDFYDIIYKLSSGVKRLISTDQRRPNETQL